MNRSLKENCKCVGHETLDCVFETNLHIEEVQSEGTPLFLLLFDYKNLLDFIIQEIIWGLATWWGMLTGIVRLLKTSTRNLAVS